MSRTEQIQELEEIIRNEHGNIRGMIVRNQGEVTYEQYFNGFTGDDTLHIFSVTKSIVSLLIGIAIDQGLIKGTDQNILEFFPEYRLKRGERTLQQITIEDLLIMTVPYKYKSAPYTKYFGSHDWVTSSLDLMGGKGRIGDFRYAPLIGPDVLSGILTQVSGMSVLEFAQKNLFSPLGISVEGNVVFSSKEEQLLWYKSPTTKGWVSDPSGHNTTGWGLSLAVSDMGKLGQLCLNEGVWEGKIIVSSEWIKRCSMVHSMWGEKKYGYLWWIIDEDERSFAALGDGGNVIYVNPSRQLVVAILAGFQPRVKDRIELIQRYFGL